MGLVVVALACALLVGRATGGSVSRLGELGMRGYWLVFAALGAQVLGALAPVAGLPAGPSWAVGLTVSALLAAGFLFRARRVAGIGLIALGLGLNALVVAANGAMPVSPTASARAGIDTGPLAAGSRHAVLDGSTRLPALADVIPVPLPLRPEVLSIGDVLVVAGLARLVYVGMHSGPAPSPAGVPRWAPQTRARRESDMAKRARKRKARAKKKSNHGKKPNC
jgi:hypothetical protein